MGRASCVAVLPALLVGALVVTPVTAQGGGGPPGKPGSEQGDKKVRKAVKGRTAARDHGETTEGIIGGVDRLERFSRERRRPAGVGRDDESHPARGRTRETPVENSDLTRWERVKEVLRDFVRAYVNKDSSALMRLLSRNFQNDSSILLNAVLDDYQRDENINVDVELLQYRVSFGTVEVEARWFRTATDLSSGTTTVNQGTIRLLFDRFHDMLIKLFQGAPFFGLNDPQWQEQAKAGDPNAGGGGNVGVIQTQAGLTFETEATGPGNDHFSIDIDTGKTFAAYDIDSQGAPPPTVAGHDFLFHFSSCISGFCSVNVGTDSGTNNVSPGFPDQSVDFCPGIPATLEDFSSIDPLALVSGDFLSFPDDGNPHTFVFSVETDGGNFGLVEVEVESGPGSPFAVTVRWVNVGSDPSDTGFTGGTTCN